MAWKWGFRRTSLFSKFNLKMFHSKNIFKFKWKVYQEPLHSNAIHQSLIRISKICHLPRWGTLTRKHHILCCFWCCWRCTVDWKKDGLTIIQESFLPIMKITSIWKFFEWTVYLSFLPIPHQINNWNVKQESLYLSLE